MTETLPRKCSASVDYISASINRFSRAADVSDDSIVAFGSSSLIAIWPVSEDENTGVKQTLYGHEGRVTALRFKDGESCFLSTDDKGYLKSWRRNSEKWYNTATLRAHSSAISALAVCKDCVATGSSDGSVIVWQHVYSQEYENDEFAEVQRLDMKGKYPLDIVVTHLPDSDGLIMAVSATEWNVSIFVRSEEKFFRAASLPGHEDWVKTLAFQRCIAGPSILTLASGSQDSTIRLWNIERLVKKKPSSTGQEGDVLNDELLDSFEASLGDLAEGEEGGRQISMKRHIVTVSKKDGSSIQYAITFDALLVGHEAGVTSIIWRPPIPDSRPMLLSTSADSSLTLWAPSSISATAGGQSTSLWINQQRFGDIGGQRLGGFIGALWACRGNDALAWGWGGGWRRWRCLSNDSPTESWKEVNTTSGHNGAVHGISWSPNGEYLISTSPDQTTRIHGNINAKSDQEAASWHEISRPQVHGYDLNDAVFLSATRFVSIADEKVARVFEAPRSFVLLCKHLGLLPDVEDEAERPLAASVPPLGLSNKALNNAESAEAHFPMPSVSMTERRPYEGELVVSTLWPEIEKVFGHGYELHAIAASPSGKYIATACRATSPEHAGIKVYDSHTWLPFGQTLLGHQLTVTRIAFSPDNQYILSVSRDRSWRLFERADDGFVPIVSDKSHARIIWDCAWSHEGDLFATASRDKMIKLWKLPDRNKDKQEPAAIFRLKEAATAVSFTTLGEGRRLLAVGVEVGHIFIYFNNASTSQKWDQILHLDQSIAHIDQIHRLQWKPVSPDLSSNKKELATCSEDGTLRIFQIHV